MQTELDIPKIAERFCWPGGERNWRIFTYIVLKAVKLLDCRKIILFGSRARGDNNEFSDFDFAVELGRNKKNWAEFCLDVENNLETLLKIDIVRLDEASEKTLKQIYSTGKTIYEK